MSLLMSRSTPQAASIALLGNFMAASLAAAVDGNGGTFVNEALSSADSQRTASAKSAS
jgi:hypothetical protein